MTIADLLVNGTKIRTRFILIAIHTGYLHIYFLTIIIDLK